MLDSIVQFRRTCTVSIAKRQLMDSDPISSTALNPMFPFDQYDTLRNHNSHLHLYSDFQGDRLSKAPYNTSYTCRALKGNMYAVQTNGILSLALVQSEQSTLGHFEETNTTWSPGIKSISELIY